MKQLKDHLEDELNTIIDQVEKGEVTMQGVADNLSMLKNEVASMKFNFPTTLDPKEEAKIVDDVIKNSQDAMAKEFVEREPELRFRKELSPAECFMEFQDYMVHSVATKIARNVAEKVYIPSLTGRYEDMLSKTNAKNFKAMYKKAKNE